MKFIKRVGKKQPTIQSANRVPKASYYSGSYQPNQQASPFRRKTVSSKSWNLTKIIDRAVIVAVVFCVGYSLIVRPNPKVVSSSATYHSASDYADFAAKVTGSLYDRNKLTYREADLINKMQKQFPEISSAYVEVPIFGQKTTLHLTISSPAFIYSNQNVGYVLDNQGVIVNTQAALPNISGLPTIIDQSNIPVGQGTKVVSSDSIDFINTVIAQAKRAKVSVSNIVLPAVAQEIQLRTTDKAYYVKFYFGNDALTQTGQWLAARHDFDAKGTNPAEYLDVRVPGKVFYK